MVTASERTSSSKSLLLTIGKICFITGTFIPIIILALRVWNYPLLLQITPGGYVTQNPLSSFCFILMGFCLWILRDEKKSDRLRIVARIFALVISATGFIKVLSLITGFDFTIDLLFFRNQLYIPVYHDTLLFQWNAMAPNTAMCFFFLGLTVFFIDTNRRRLKVFMQYLDYFIVLVAMLSIYGYIYEVKKLYGVFRAIPMSFHSALCFLLFSFSVLILRPDKGTMAILIGENPAEMFFIRLVALLLPLVFGFVKIQGWKVGLYDEEFGTALFAVLTFVISMVFIGMKSVIQNDLRRAKAEILEITREDNERLKRILDSSPTFINIYDRDEDKLIYSNTSGGRQYGYKVRTIDVSFPTFIEMRVHPEDREKVRARSLNYNPAKDDEYNVLIYRLYDEDKNERWIYSRAIVYKRVEGRIKQLLFNAMDITELKKVQDALAESNRLIEKITTATPDILYIYDLNDRKNVYANRNFTENLGYTPDEIYSFGSALLPSLIHPDDLKRMNTYYEVFRHANDNELREIEYRVKDKQGNWKWMSNREVVFQRDDAGNAATQVIGIAQDITSRKQHEEALRGKNEELSIAYKQLEETQQQLKQLNAELEERVRIRTGELKQSEERYRSYIVHSFDGIWRYELEGISYVDITLPLDEQVRLLLQHAYIAECNDKIAQMYGFGSAREIIGIKLSDFIRWHEDLNNEFVVSFIQSGYKLIDQQTKEVNKRGDVSYFQSNVVGVVEDNKLVRWWRTQRDITSLKNAYIALADQNEKINNQVKRLEAIAWQQSHEVRRPLANILGLVNILRTMENQSEEDRQMYLHYLYKSSEELDEIIHRIVGYAANSSSAR